MASAKCPKPQTLNPHPPIQDRRRIVASAECCAWQLLDESVRPVPPHDSVDPGDAATGEGLLSLPRLQMLEELLVATNYARAAYGHVMGSGHMSDLTRMMVGVRARHGVRPHV